MGTLHIQAENKKRTKREHKKEKKQKMKERKGEEEGGITNDRNSFCTRVSD